MFPTLNDLKEIRKIYDEYGFEWNDGDLIYNEAGYYKLFMNKKRFRSLSC